MPMRLLVCVFCILILAPGCRAVPQRVPLFVTSGPATHVFQVEIAQTPAEQERGLMFREKLAADHGMLFVYDTPQQLTFWMKNTPLPLDLVFIDAAARIVYLHENAEPFSTTLITAPVPAQMVLEINGGRARQLGIRVGDTVSREQP